jgi:hypothetical protein
MPEKLDRCVKKLMDEGHDESSAWAICQASIKKAKKGVKMTKKAIVLKSMRTSAGAEDWARLMRSKYPNAKVVDTETLKSYGSLMDPLGLPPVNPMPSASHVIMEEDLSPVVNVLKKSDVGEIIKVMMDKGYMEVDSFGPCLTEKWHKMVKDYISSALKDALKSAGEYTYDFDGEVSTDAEMVIKSLETVMKALEDSEALASMGEATENADFGHALRDNEAISDAEAKAGFEHDAPAADVRDPEMDGEAVSDEAVDSATHEADHNSGKEVLAQPGNTARKSVEDADDYMYMTFKSVDEARAWKNPDIGVYQVAPVSESERKLFGEDAKYVVRGRFEWYEHSLKSATSTEADKRTQGLTAPESVSDDGGTDAVEARAKKVDALKSMLDDEQILKSIIDEVVEDLLPAREE